MNTNRLGIAAQLALALVVLAPMISACEARISRNSDGSLAVETTVSQQELQAAITAGIADPLVKSVQVTLQTGYILVTGTRQRLNDASRSDALSFRLDLAAQNGQLVAAVSDALLDGVPVEQNRVSNWNQTIANRLQQLAQRRPNTKLQSVTITPASVQMTWQVTR